MTALNVKPSVDFKVDTTTGEAFISGRAVARLCGVSHTAIQQKIKKLGGNHTGTNTNENKQLNGNLAFDLVAEYANQGNVQAVRSLVAIGRAGIRAYIYSQVGYDPLVKEKPNKLHEPCVPVRWLCQQLGRSRASVDRTLNVSIHRMRSFGLSTEVVFVNAERCVSPALIICSMFTGKEMQRIRAWLLNIAETDALPDANTLLQLARP